MARGFNVTQGSASTDRIQTVITAHSTTRTYAIWANPRAHVNGSMFDKSNAGVQFERVQDSSDGTNTFQYKRTWSGAIGQWGSAQPSLATWTHVVVTYDGGNSANAPAIYYNGVSQSVSTQVAASGTLSTNTDAYWIGNRGNADRCWDGMLAEAAIWNRILTQAEITALGTNKKSARFIPGLVEYIPMTDNPVTSWITTAPTVTGTASQTHPPIAYTKTRSNGEFGQEYGVGYQMPF